MVKMVKKILECVELLLMDVDGVLTNGQIIYDAGGNEIKPFNVRDGLGIRLLLKAGVSVGVITGRDSKGLSRRCHELGMNYLRFSVKDKRSSFEDLLKEIDISPENIAFIGDDLPDLPVMIRVGLPIAVAQADRAVLDISKLITSAEGGHGAVREVAELILKAKKKWDEVTECFFK